MNNGAECDECRAIMEELMGAVAELRASPAWDEVRADCEAFLGIVRGEENEDRTAEVLGKLRFRPQHLGPPGTPESRTPRIRDAVRRMLQHRERTGHKVLFRK